MSEMVVCEGAEGAGRGQETGITRVWWCSSYATTRSCGRSRPLCKCCKDKARQAGSGACVISRHRVACNGTGPHAVEMRSGQGVQSRCTGDR